MALTYATRAELEAGISRHTLVDDAGRLVVPENNAWHSDIRAYGATSGAEDNRAAIQACIDAAHTSKLPVFIPPGNWRVSDYLTYYTETSIRGVGYHSRIIGNGIAGSILRPLGFDSAQTEHPSFRDFSITNGDRALGIGLDLRNTSLARVTNVWLDHVGIAVFLHVDGVLGAYYNRIRDCIFAHCEFGVYLEPIANENTVAGCQFGTVDYPVKFAADISRGTVLDNSMEVFRVGVAVGAGCHQVAVVGNRFENAPTSGTGIDIAATAIGTVAPRDWNQFVSVTATVADAGTGTVLKFGT
jgi:hypothetical protein